MVLFHFQEEDGTVVEEKQEVATEAVPVTEEVPAPEESKPDEAVVAPQETVEPEVETQAAQPVSISIPDLPLLVL